MLKWLESEVNLSKSKCYHFLLLTNILTYFEVKINHMKRILILNIIFIFPLFLFAQTFEWASKYGGTSGDNGNAVAIDAAGNIYTTGYFQNTVDFDPGPAVYNLGSSGSEDIFIVKSNSAGNLIWARKIGGPAVDIGYYITTDDSGNVYTTGLFMGTADFDPGAGTTTLTSNGGTDIFISKLDSSGNFIWANSVGGNNNDHGRFVVSDSSGNIYVTGFFQSIADFDPGASTFNLTSAGNHDAFLLKLNAAGDFIWAGNMGGSLSDDGYSIRLSSTGFIYLSGFFQGTADMDPGAGVFNLTATGSSDIFILKLDTAGNLLWAKSIGGSNSTFVTAMKLDSDDNVLLTGYFDGNTDFDPGTDTTLLTSNGNQDIFVSKLDSAGNFMWAKSMGGTGNDAAFGIDVSTNDAIFLSGYFRNTVDFNPDTSSNILTSAGDDDIFILKLNSTGDLSWAKRIGGSGLDRSFSIAVNDFEEMYATGFFYGTADFDPGVPVYNISSAGSADVFVLKLSPCVPPALNITSSDPDCYGGTGTATVIASGGSSPYNYFWSDGQTTQTASGLIAGTYQVTVTDNNSCVTTSGVTIVQPDSITSNLSSTPTNFSSSCNGTVVAIPTGGTPPYNITWSSGTTTNLCEGWYIVTISDANNCVETDSVYVDFQCPVINLSVSSTGPPFCAGDIETITVNATGGSAPYSYLWSSGDTTSSVNLPHGTYTVTITDADSCTATTSVSLSQAPPPIVSNISSTPTNYTSPNCNGSVSINPTGGTPPYNITWSSGTTTNLCEGWYTATITDANGCMLTDSVYINFVTGMEELNAAGISIFPNPVQDVLTINSEKEIGEIKIYDVVGKLMKHELIINDSAEIDVREFDAGVYSVEIDGAIAKFVKE